MIGNVIKDSILQLIIILIMVDYEIVCSGIAFIYCKQDKQEKVVNVANFIGSIFGDVKFISKCLRCRDLYVIFEVSTNLS